MINITSFLVADNIQQDPISKKLNVQGIFEVINTESVPALHKRMFTFVAFEGEDKKYDYKLTISFNSNIIGTINQPVNKAIGKTHYVISEVKDFPIVGEGSYIFEAKIDHKTIRKVIEVIVTK